MAGEEEPVEADPVGRRAFTRSVRGCDWVNEDGPTRAPAPNLEGQFKRLDGRCVLSWTFYTKLLKDCVR